MASKYCINCGEKHDYTLEIPKFCSNCGTPFAGVIPASPKAPVKTVVAVRQKHVEINNEEEDADKEVPQISKIQVEIEVDNAPKIAFANARNSRSFARDKATKPLTEGDLTKKLDDLFKTDRENQKESK